MAETVIEYVLRRLREIGVEDGVVRLAERLDDTVGLSTFRSKYAAVVVSSGRVSGSGDLPPGGDVVVAGGMESMTPGGSYLAPGARAGYRYGESALVDPTAHDALFCSVDMRGMGAATDFYNKAKDIGRAEQDEYAAMSHDRAATAAKNALLDDEIVAVEVPQRRGDPLQVSQDDGVRSATTAESLGKLRPAFAPDGTVTAGSASRTSELAKRALRKSARS